MRTRIKSLLLSKPWLRPLYKALRPLNFLFRLLKTHLKTLWFVLYHVLPILIVTRRKPVIFSRHMALGDVICTFPAASELKTRHPGATFIYSCRADYACLPRMGKITSHVVSNLDCRLLKTFYSFLFAGIYQFTYGDEYPNSVSTESVIEEYCRQHGVPITDDHPRLQINPEVRSKVSALLEREGLNKGGPLVIIHPGPSGPFREWAEKSWIELVQKLNNHGFKNIIQLGAKRHDDVGRALYDNMPNVVSLINRLTLEESIALISLCDLVIGIDSGLIHVAASVGTPAVGIFGSTSPQLRFSPANARSFVVSKVECQGCHHRIPRLHWVTGCPFDFKCMKSIQADDVLQACLSRMSEGRDQRLKVGVSA